jgi:cytochrome c5
MIAAALLLLAVAVLALARLPLDTGAGAPRGAYPANFPDGEGRAIAERACLLCHSAMLATQQAKDSTGWEKTLATMEKWGAPVQGAEHDTLRTYLLAHFGPRSPKR